MAIMKKYTFVPDRETWLVSFWKEVTEASYQQGYRFKFGSLISDSWYQVGIDRRGVCLNLVVAPTESRIQVELCIKPGKYALQKFDALHEQRKQIENAIGCPLIWHRRSSNTHSFIRLSKEVDARSNDRSLAVDWYVATLATFVSVFQRYLLN